MLHNEKAAAALLLRDERCNGIADCVAPPSRLHISNTNKCFLATSSVPRVRAHAHVRAGDLRGNLPPCGRAPLLHPARCSASAAPDASAPLSSQTRLSASLSGVLAVTPH